MQPQKAAYVDGASLQNMARLAGVRFISAERLFSFLLRRVGQIRSFFKGHPTITMEPGVAESSVGNVFRRKGFNILSVEGALEADDFALLRRICRIKAGTVDELVIMSADHCFIDIAREKARLGIRIIWVAADIIDNDGKPIIGNELRGCFRQDEFEFVDLAPAISKLAFNEPQIRRH